MKTFYYPLGHEAGKTMTVAELREKLNEFPQDMPVFGFWEGVHGWIAPENFSTVHLDTYGKQPEHIECLLIDVNDY